MATLVNRRSNNNGIFDGVFEEDDSDAWSPLNQNKTTHGSHTSITSTVQSKSTTLPMRNSVREDSTAHSQSNQSQISTSQSFFIQELIINKPLSRFGRIFLLHFVTELWSYHVSIRLGILLLLFALICQVMSLIYLLFITICNFLHMLFTSVLLAFAAYIYLFQIDNNNMLHKYWRAVFKIPEAILNSAFLCLESIDGRGMRRVALAIFMTPILLEMWALTFLARVLGESGVPRDEDGRGVMSGCSISFKFLLLELILLVPIYCHVGMDNDNNCNTANTHHNELDLHGGSSDGMSQLKSVLKIWKMTITNKGTTTLSQCRTHALIYLYISTLLATIFTMKYGQIHRPILLAGPFLFASGTLLFPFSFRRRGDGSSVLSELVQSAIRFALKDALERLGENVAEDEMLKLAMLRWIVDYWTFSLSPSSPTSPLSSDKNSTCTERTLIQTSSSVLQNEVSEEGGISWYVLATMLGMTTAQMQNEAPPTPSGNSECCNQNSSVCNLQYMLSSLDVDKRAKPAVMSYEMAVEECPPSRWIAIILASMRRCPSLFSITCLYMSGSIHRVHIAITLSPLIILELMRMKQWYNSCRRTMVKPKGKEDDHNTVSLWIPIEMEPMDILLSRDNYSLDNLGPALQVWGNLKDSVVALQSGLTAMRCIQPAQLATELAFDVISLTKFASEISRRNLPHRLGILALDIWHLYVEKSSTESSPSCGRDGGHDQLSSVIFNVQNISRNIQKVTQEGRNESNTFTLIINGVKVLFKHKWLWYQDEFQASKQNNSGDEIDQVPATVDVVISEELKHNSIGTDNCQLKISDAEGIVNKHDHDHGNKLNIVVYLNKTLLHGINEQYKEENEEPLNIKYDIKNENTAPMFSETLQDTQNGESAQMLKDFKVEGAPVEGLDQNSVDGLDWNKKKSNQKCMIRNNSVKEESQQGSQNREPSKIIQVDLKNFSDTSDELQDKNTESASMLEDVRAQEISAEDQNQSSNDRIEDSENEEKKCGAIKNDIKIVSQDNTNREPSIIHECETYSLSANSDNIESQGLFDLIEDTLSFTSDDGSWTEIEHMDLNINTLQTSAVIDIQKRNVSPNNITVCNETVITEESKNDSRFKIFGVGLAALGTMIGSIATANSRDRKEENASTLMNCNRRSNIEKTERINEDD